MTLVLGILVGAVILLLGMAAIHNYVRYLDCQEVVRRQARRIKRLQREECVYQIITDRLKPSKN